MADLFYPPLVPTPQNPAPRDRALSVVTDVFDSRYYSGLDIGIYLDGFYLDEAVQLQYQVSENRTPYYGYHSYTYHRAAPGTRLIQGTFAINFQATFFIYKLLNQIRAREAVGAGVLKPDPKTFRTVQQALSGDLTLNDFLRQADSGASPEAQLKALHSVADNLDAALWGAPNSSGLSVDPSRPLFDAGPNGFSLYLRYGEPLVKTSQLRQDLQNPLKTGSIPDLQTQSVPQGATMSQAHPAGTLHRLVGVDITGVGQSINDQGQPILELYSFIARDLDEALPTGG